MEELVKEQPVYEIQKVKIKNNQLTAEYTEKFVEANYKNNILKESEQFIHPDLLYALNRLKPHVVKICEMHEATLVNVANPSDDDLNEKLKNIIVTGYSKGGNDESAGVSIQAQKLLKSGQILNLSVPFTKYEDESGDGYLYGAELKEASVDVATRWTLTCSKVNMASSKNPSISIPRRNRISRARRKRSQRNGDGRKKSRSRRSPRR